MKIQICSDLHLEYAVNRAWLKENPLIPVGDILLIAGDTYHLDKDFAALEFIQQASRDFDAVYLIPGNHEYYGGYDSETAMTSMHVAILENVFIVNNYAEDFDGTKFIFSTMWSHIRTNKRFVEQNIMDFYQIRYKNNPLSAEHFNSLHEYAFNFIRSEVMKPGKKVVVTHHLPSSKCNADEFDGSILNEAFCTDKSQFIANHDIDYWVYGHSHRNVLGKSIGKTSFVTNQLGYIQWNEQGTFDRQKTIEV